MAIKKTLSIILSLALWAGPLGCPHAAAKFGVRRPNPTQSSGNPVESVLGWAGTPAGQDPVPRLNPALSISETPVSAFTPVIEPLSRHYPTPEAANGFLKRLEGFKSLSPQEQEVLVLTLATARAEAIPDVRSHLHRFLMETAYPGASTMEKLTLLGRFEAYPEEAGRLLEKMAISVRLQRRLEKAWRLAEETRDRLVDNKAEQDLIRLLPRPPEGPRLGPYREASEPSIEIEPALSRFQTILGTGSKSERTRWLANKDFRRALAALAVDWRKYPAAVRLHEGAELADPYFRSANWIYSEIGGLPVVSIFGAVATLIVALAIGFHVFSVIGPLAILLNGLGQKSYSLRDLRLAKALEQASWDRRRAEALASNALPLEEALRRVRVAVPAGPRAALTKPQEELAEGEVGPDRERQLAHAPGN